MEQMSQGLVHVSKGKNIVIVETKITNKATQVQADKELYEFVDNLVENGGSRKPPSRYHLNLKLRLLLV